MSALAVDPAEFWQTLALGSIILGVVGMVLGMIEAKYVPLILGIFFVMVGAALAMSGVSPT